MLKIKSYQEKLKQRPKKKKNWNEKRSVEIIQYQIVKWNVFKIHKTEKIY